MIQVKKAIILLGSMGTRFLPLSKTVPKELWPLVDKPIIHYILEELKDAGITKIIFVLSPDRKHVLSYLKRAPKLENILKKKKKDKALLKLKNLDEFQKDLTISFVLQREPLGNGHALLQAKTKLAKAPFIVLFGDDIIDSETPAISQLLKVFKTCQKPVITLAKISQTEIMRLGGVSAEKIAHRLFKIRDIITKPVPEKLTLGLAVVGKMILTPDIFDYLKTKKVNEKGEITIIHALKSLLQGGKVVYGYEVQGEWLRCGDKLGWLKSNFYLALKHPEYGHELKRYLKANI